ncbi:MAG: polyprenyl synthetase family protein [Bacteroides sp.]|nr:polyprenyl synthetase family protein [Bacteroides sp.]
MYSLEKITDIVNQFVSNIQYDRQPRRLYEPIEYTLQQSGKRIRPALLLMAYNIYKEDVEKALNQAAAIEIYHNYTLLHDDIMDKAEIRRGRPTVHRVWNENAAILSGDAMMILAYKYMADCNHDTLKRILPVFTITALEVCEGQQMDMMFEERNDVKAEEYIEMIRLKTSVLIAASLKIGAMVAEADDEDADNLYNFGINIGLAFQLQDDLLDVYGNVAKFGKNVGGDIVSNKKTFMLIKAMELAQGETKERLLSLINAKEFDKDNKIKEVTQIYNQLGIRAVCEAKMNDYYDSAMSCLDKVKVGEDAKKELRSLAKELLDREV